MGVIRNSPQLPVSIWYRCRLKSCDHRVQGFGIFVVRGRRIHPVLILKSCTNVDI